MFLSTIRVNSDPGDKGFRKINSGPDDLHETRKRCCFREGLYLSPGR